jgi:hypothetical protein
MALQIRRGTEAERTAGGGVVFADGELIYVTDTDALYIGDGVTQGGLFLTSDTLGLLDSFLQADSIADELQLQKDLNLNSKNIIGAGNINIDGNVVATGNIDIGDNTADTVTITAQVDSNITPTADTEYDLGSETRRWRNIFTNGLTVDGEVSAVSINSDVLANDSTLLVDATNGTVNISNQSIDALLDVKTSGAGHDPLDGQPLVWHASMNHWMPQSSAVLNVTGDVKGSVFGDDSTLLVDSVEGVLRGSHIGTLSGNVLSEDGSIILNPGTDGTNANIVSDVQGNVTGNLTGSVTGDVTGNITGNVSGNVDGDLEGSVFGDDSTLLVDAVSNNIPGENISGTVTATFVGDVTGNVTGDVTGNVTGDVTGNILTNSIDSADSSAIIVTPTLETQSDLIANQSLTVGVGDFAGPGTANVILRNTGEILVNRVTAGTVGTGDPDNVELVFDSKSAFEKQLTLLGQTNATADFRVLSFVGQGNNFVVETYTGDPDSDTELEDPNNYEVHFSANNNVAEFGVPAKFAVVADDTARNTLVPTPEKGMVILMESGTSPAATNQLQYYNGSAWVNL